MLAHIEDGQSSALEASESKLRRFVADASHELRTPLAAVRAYAELFTRGAASRPDDLERSMKGISRESERMSVLVEDLLLLAHLDEGRPLTLEPIAFEDVVAEAVETARTLEPDRPLEADLTPSTVLGDHDRLRQVVDNLLSNVRAHTPPEAPLRVTLAHDGETAVLAVADSGPGMDAETRDARLRALLPRRPVPRPRERRRGPRPRDRRRGRRGARRHGRGRVGARRGDDRPRAHPARSVGRSHRRLIGAAYRRRLDPFERSQLEAPEIARHRNRHPRPPSRDRPGWNRPQLWSQAGCGGCHTLNAAGSTGTNGPNLDSLRPSAAAVADQVTYGGGGMPSFGGSLSSTDIQALATWVSQSAGGSQRKRVSHQRPLHDRDRSPPARPEEARLLPRPGHRLLRPAHDRRREALPALGRPHRRRRLGPEERERLRRRLG